MSNKDVKTKIERLSVILTMNILQYRILDLENMNSFFRALGVQQYICIGWFEEFYFTMGNDYWISGKISKFFVKKYNIWKYNQKKTGKGVIKC